MIKVLDILGLIAKVLDIMRLDILGTTQYSSYTWPPRVVRMMNEMLAKISAKIEALIHISKKIISRQKVEPAVHVPGCMSRLCGFWKV